MLQNRRMPPCRDCHREWTFTVLEQALFAERMYQHDPSRCPECREARKARREKGEARGHNGRSDPQMHVAICARCGGQARLPFKPSKGRPVYCHDCHRRIRAAG